MAGKEHSEELFTPHQTVFKRQAHSRPIRLVQRPIVSQRLPVSSRFSTEIWQSLSAAGVSVGDREKGMSPGRGAVA